jgi:hypothetical protein
VNVWVMIPLNCTMILRILYFKGWITSTTIDTDFTKYKELDLRFVILSDAYHFIVQKEVTVRYHKKIKKRQHKWLPLVFSLIALT